MADANIKGIPIKDIRQEEGAHELASSPDMKPYLAFIKAVIQDHDPSPELEAIRRLHLEKLHEGGVWPPKLLISDSNVSLLASLGFCVDCCGAVFRRNHRL